MSLNTDRQHEHLQARAAHVSIWVSILSFLIPLSAGLISDSIALLLDASTGFVSMFIAFIMRVSIKKINLPPDRLFNFGYEKFEPFTVVIQGAMIMLSCLIAIKFAVQDIIHEEAIVRYDIPVIASLASGLLALGASFRLKVVAAKTHSNMLKVSGMHWGIESILSFAMCLGFSLGYYLHNHGYLHLAPYIDPVMALALALIFVWSPLKAMKSSFRELLDAVPEREVAGEIEKLVEKHKVRSFGIRSIQMRKAGNKVFLYVCFVIHGHTTLAQAQEFSESFERDIAARFPKYHTIVYFYPAH